VEVEEVVLLHLFLRVGEQGEIARDEFRIIFDFLLQQGGRRECLLGRIQQAFEECLNVLLLH
jgi:hypothetical protein